ncbi:MAG TPA: beta-N-acetylhexosaminidase [Chromatiales bacterium]|nr:beta-N-acetylhexosaminidase [Chromatiales bacterium]
MRGAARVTRLGPVMADVEGPALTPADRELLLRPEVGGVILFARNYVSPDQVRSLTAAIHALRHPRLLIAVDQEGGRVQRFIDGFTRLPPAAALGGLYERDRQRAREAARELGWLMAAELKAVGVDFSFAPVLDLDRGLSAVIGDRAFHHDPEVVADLAHHYVLGMRQAGMEAVGKHFPGHGAVVADSHVELPVDPRPEVDILAEDAVPFERLVGYGLAGLMPAHMIFEAVDPVPVGFSEYWLRTVLRRRWRFEGAIFSDDLSMAAARVAGEAGARARAALAAGCDMVLVCNDRVAAWAAVEAVAGHEEPASQARLARMHGHTGMSWDALRETARWKAARRLARGLEGSA